MAKTDKTTGRDSTGLNARFGAGQAGIGPQHPSADLDVRTRDDVLELDPHRIEADGPYVRSIEEVEADPDFPGFVEGVKQAGRIDQPVLVRIEGKAVEDRRYIIVYGMRRWRAALAAGLEKISATTKKDMNEAEALKWQLIENKQRGDPPKLNEARGFWIARRMLSMTQKEFAALMGTGQGRISIYERIGEAVDGLSDAERRKLLMAEYEDKQRPTETKRITVEAMQEIARDYKDDLDGRKKALLALVDDDTPSKARKTVAQRRTTVAPIRGQDLRDGRRFTMRWKETDLESGAGFIRTVRGHFETEVDAIIARLETLQEAEGADEALAGALQEARRLKDALEDKVVPLRAAEG